MLDLHLIWQRGTVPCGVAQAGALVPKEQLNPQQRATSQHGDLLLVSMSL
jgi:hypothetical protein